MACASPDEPCTHVRERPARQTKATGSATRLRDVALGPGIVRVSRQPVVHVRRRTETEDAPDWQGAGRENIAQMGAWSNPPSPRLRRDQAKARLRVTAPRAGSEAPPQTAEDSSVAPGVFATSARPLCGRA